MSLFSCIGRIAQLVEQLTLNQRVQGSKSLCAHHKIDNSGVAPPSFRQNWLVLFAFAASETSGGGCASRMLAVGAQSDVCVLCANLSARRQCLTEVSQASDQEKRRPSARSLGERQNKLGYDGGSVRRQNLVLTQTEIDPSFAASLRRRIRFFCLYLSARAHLKTLEKLVPIVEDAFTHPWVAGVELKIQFWPGNETWFGRLWRLYRSLPTSSMHWDAPVAVSVFRKRNGKKKLALCMSLYVVDKTLYVGQLQGVAGTDIPKELRAWPKLLVEACRTFARQENLRSVKVPSAEVALLISPSGS